jgi:hypothetical protein
MRHGKETPSGSFDCGIAPCGRAASAQDDKVSAEWSALNGLSISRF